ncbi:histidine kinase N-terminal 7TM domain-containing diguanylate cyclase [Halalkalibacter okhensis]|uniref:Diguanylate cyclase n=1 Tax=Halalkalibacter okhensis TaxID=333138 RepID=A0A0B0IGI9_9BACI|nr:histidine kinase N-terminal 7TM domain-containing protein [Halalkalibacter okhensis]KHF39987.1 diguanylate cyclase [Halalkalibacter okhensis]
MAQEVLVYILLGIFGGMLSLFLCVYAILKIKYAPGGKYYILATFMSAIFTFAYALELTSTSIEEIKFWLRMEYIGLPFIPVFILFMCMEYVGFKQPRWLPYVMYTIPIITITMHFTNEFHHLYYKSMMLRSDTPFPIILLEGGPFFYIHSIYLYICIILSILILLIQLRKLTLRFRLQILMMVAGLIIPIVGSVFYLTGLSPYGVDLGPVSMSISFLFHGAALISFQMFNVAPIARDKVFESLKEGVVVLNQSNIIVDYNQAILQVTPFLNAKAIGKSIIEVLHHDQKLKDLILSEEEVDFTSSKDDKVTYYHISFSPVLSKTNEQIGQIITFVDVTARVQMQEQLQKLASIDGLTQVYNRTFFVKEVEQTVADYQKVGGNVSFIMFDIDHFKSINDTYGHEAGDIVITYVAQIAKECLRETDIIGRYGGEEFIICLPNTHLPHSNQIAEAIRMKIENSYIVINKKEIHVTSSFGVTSKIVEWNGDVHLISELMRQADEALYEAKKNGRNCVECFSSRAAM